MDYIKLLTSTKAQLLIIIFLTAIVYSNTLSSQFALDDHLFVVDWEVTKDFKNIPLMFTKEFAPGLGEHSGVYRPMRTVYYAISRQIWGTNPFGYHLQALLVHLIITTLVYFITRQIVISSWFIVHSKDTKLLATNYQPPTMNYLPFITALLFGLHPIHTEAISYITASFDAISYVFFFGSFYLYLKVREVREVREVWGNKQLLIISLLFAGVAFFGLEMTLILPILLLLYDYCFKYKSLKFFKDLKVLKVYGFYFLIAAFYLFIRVFLLQITSRGEYLGGSVYLTMLTMVKVVAGYISLLVLPLNLSINPTISSGINSWDGMGFISRKLLSQKIYDSDILISIIFIIIIIFIAVKAWKKFPLITFSIFWFFISLLPVLYIIPQGPVMQERYIYLASFGYVLLLGWGLGKLGELGWLGKYGRKKLVTGYWLLFTFAFLLLTFYGVRTYIRNQDWKTGASIWFSLIKQIPNDPYTNLVIGTYYDQVKDYPQAARYYKNAIKNKPDYKDAYLSLAQINVKSGARTEYKSENLSFVYPKDWIITEDGNDLHIKDSKGLFNISLSLSETSQSARDYLSSRKEESGNPIKEGPALIPGFDSSYVKMFQDQEVKKMVFYIFSGNKVMKILVYPADSLQMEEFDKVLGSVKIN